jgi:FOG: WD40 repeat
VWTTVFSPDGKTIATGGGNDWTVRLWNSVTGELIRPLVGAAVVEYIAFSPDGNTIVTGAGDIWHTSTGARVGRFSGGAVAFSPDGKTIAAAGSAFDDVVRIWDVDSIKQISTLNVPAPNDTELNFTAFSPDRKFLAACGYEGTIQLWDSTTNKPVRTLKHPGGAYEVAFSTDGRLGSSGGGTVRVWDPTNGELVRSFADTQQFAFQPNGPLIATASTKDFSVQLWNVSSGRMVHSFQDHTDAIAGLTFSPDGRILAAGSRDHSVRLWSVTPYV